MGDYPDNPGPLPASKLCNKNPPYNPIQGEGALGNQYSGRMFYREGDKEELVRTLQEMLTTLGYDIGAAGVDGKFGNNTEKAVKQFQEENKNWEGNLLKVDGLVGPRTSDALNRAMVGLWYDHYQTPKELVEGKPYHTATSDFLADGLSLEPGMAQEAKVFLIGKIPDIVRPIPAYDEFMILFPALGLPAIMENNAVNVILLFNKDSNTLKNKSAGGDNDWKEVKEVVANQLGYTEWNKRDSAQDQKKISPDQLVELSWIDVSYKDNDGKISFKDGDKEINLIAAKHALDHLAKSVQFDTSRVLRLKIKLDDLGEKLYNLANKNDHESEYVAKALQGISVPGNTPKMKNEMETLRKKNQVKLYHPFYVSNKESLSVGHATDIHISTRWELYERILKKHPPDNFDISQFNNYNKTFSDLLQAANQKADLIILTGDLIDYNRGHKIDISKNDDNTHDKERDFEKHYLFNRNWVLFYELLLENYQKPIFTVLGNHDYLLNPYNTNARIRVSLIGKPIPIIDIPIMTESNSFAGDMNLKESEVQFEQPLEFSLGVGKALDLAKYREEHNEEELAPLIRENAKDLIENKRSGCWYADKEAATWYFLVINPFKDYCVTYKKMSFLMLDWNVKQFDGSLLLLPRPTDCISPEQFKLIDKWVKHDVGVRLLCSHAPVYDPWEELGNFYLEKGIFKRNHDETKDYAKKKTNRYSPELNLGAVEEKSREKLLKNYIFNFPIHVVLSGHSHTNRIFQVLKDEKGKERVVLRRENDPKEWNTKSPFIIVTTSAGPIGRSNEVAEWMDMILSGYRVLNFDNTGEMKAEKQSFFVTSKIKKIRDEVIEDAVKNDPNFLVPAGFLGLFNKHTIKRFSTFDNTKSLDPDLSAIIDRVSGNAKIADLNDGRAIVVKKIDKGAKLSVENNDGTIVIEENHGEFIVNDNDDLINIDYNYGRINIKQNDDTLLIRENHGTIDLYNNGSDSPGTDLVKVFDNYAAFNTYKPHGNEDLIIIKRNHKKGILNIDYNNDTINVRDNRGVLNINSNEGGAFEVDSTINILDNSKGTINIKNNDGEVNINKAKKGSISKLEKSGEVNYKSESWLKDKYKFD